MKTASLILVAASLCLGLSASAKDAVVLLPQQQNNCLNRQVKATTAPPVKVQQKADTVSSTEKLIDKIKNGGVNERPIDLVICLDTSSSMDGLIGAAKQKIWDIVNELALARPKPHLRVAVYAYGSPYFGAQSGFVHKSLDLTDDLDSAFKELSALHTNGGDEYCARVISTATNELSWSKDKNALRIIVDAGNEAVNQDPKINVFDAARSSANHGIIVNTIFCGSPTDGDAAGWREVAQATHGQFACIDQNNGTVEISTPFDKKLSELSSNINRTYLAYGRGGSAGAQRQMEADALSYSMGASNSASRAYAKIAGQYRNSSWDLIDARKEKGFSLSNYGKSDLPSEMQKMNPTEQKAYLDSKAKEREAIEKQIADLNTQRAKYIQDQLKKSGKSTDKAFDTAMLRALREQAQSKGFVFETK